MMLKNKLSSKTKKNLKSYFLIFIAAILFSIGLQGFLQSAQTFSTGIGAIAVLPAYIKKELNIYVTLFYFGLNIPIVLFFWKKNNFRFMIRTTFYLLCQLLIGFIFMFPSINDKFKNLLSIGPIEQNEWAIFIYVIIGSILMGLSIALSWKCGGSTGGTDIIANYYLYKTQKSISKVLLVISLFFTAISFVITIILRKDIRGRWLITLFASLLYIMITNLIIYFVYPKYKKVELAIHSQKAIEISKILEKNEYWHSWLISKEKSGFTNQTQLKISSVMFLLETRWVILLVKDVDPNCFITIKPINIANGKLKSDKLDIL